MVEEKWSHYLNKICQLIKNFSFTLEFDYLVLMIHGSSLIHDSRFCTDYCFRSKIVFKTSLDDKSKYKKGTQLILENICKTLTQQI